MLDFAALIEHYGEAKVLSAGGALIGLLFGFSAQRSRFCLRAAVIEFWNHRFGEKLSVWLLAFSTAVVAIQLLILGHYVDLSSARQLANTGSLSGAIAGGLLFGIGMILTRGCASRLLILSANGNLRALLSGLVFAVAAQASLSGALAPLRATISSWWTVPGGGARDLLGLAGVGHWGGLLFGLVWMVAALVFSLRSGGTIWKWLGGIGAGLSVALAWWYTYSVASNSFEIVAMQGITFSGPSAEWLMRILSAPQMPLTFDFGLLPSVFIGSFLGAWLGKDLKLEGFRDGYSMGRYIIGAVLMGFGAMLAGGCAVGSGLTGGAIFALTSWLALIGMWLGAGITDRLLDHGAAQAAAAAAAASGDVFKAP